MKDRERQRRSAAAHYDANKALYKERARRSTRDSRARLRELIRARKEAPCVDCGVQYPHYVMQFDHVHGQKHFAVANAVRDALKIQRVVAEIAKCDLVCANCHAERTWQRKQHLSAKPREKEAHPTRSQGTLW